MSLTQSDIFPCTIRYSPRVKPVRTYSQILYVKVFGFFEVFVFEVEVSQQIVETGSDGVHDWSLEIEISFSVVQEFGDEFALLFGTQLWWNQFQDF